jgi:hypothetical protein
VVNNKAQEGVFIGLFALGVLVAISLAVSFMGNRVTDLLQIQGQVMAGKQSYWLSYSGIEITATNRFAGVAAATNTYTLNNGAISVLGETSADKFNGADRTNIITSTGSVADGVRKIKYTLGSSTEYALFFDGGAGDYVDIGNINGKMEMELDDDTQAITYVDGGTQADFSISFWVKPDYANMDDDYGVIIAANNCSEGDECNNDRGIIIGLLKASGFLRIWHPSSDEKDFATALSADSWHHVVYTRSAAVPENGVGTMYLNGVLLDTDPDNSWFKSAAEGELWNLGADIDTGPAKSESYAGCMDEVAIWRSVLTLTQIQTLYVQERSFDIVTNMSTNLVAYWDFDNTGSDGSVNGFNSTVAGAIYTGY